MSWPGDLKVTKVMPCNPLVQVGIRQVGLKLMKVMEFKLLGPLGDIRQFIRIPDLPKRGVPGLGGRGRVFPSEGATGSGRNYGLCCNFARSI